MGGKDITGALTRFLRGHEDLLPSAGEGDLRLVAPREGSSGDVWIAETGGRPAAIVRRCELRRAARRLLPTIKSGSRHGIHVGDSF